MRRASEMRPISKPSGNAAAVARKNHRELSPQRGQRNEWTRLRKNVIVVNAAEHEIDHREGRFCGVGMSRVHLSVIETCQSPSSSAGITSASAIDWARFGHAEGVAGRASRCRSQRRLAMPFQHRAISCPFDDGRRAGPK